MKDGPDKGREAPARSRIDSFLPNLRAMMALDRRISQAPNCHPLSERLAVIAEKRRKRLKPPTPPCASYRLSLYHYGIRRVSKNLVKELGFQISKQLCGGKPCYKQLEAGKAASHLLEVSGTIGSTKDRVRVQFHSKVYVTEVPQIKSVDIMRLSLAFRPFLHKGQMHSKKLCKLASPWRDLRTSPLSSAEIFEYLIAAQEAYKWLRCFTSRSSTEGQTSPLLIKFNVRVTALNEEETARPSELAQPSCERS